MDTRERGDDNSKATEVARFEGNMFAGGAFTIVVVADDDPFYAFVAVVCGCFGDAFIFACDLVFGLVSLIVLSVDSANEAVFWMQSVFDLRGGTYRHRRRAPT